MIAYAVVTSYITVGTCEISLLKSSWRGEEMLRAACIVVVKK